MVDMRYSSGGLDDGAAGHDECALRADGIVSLLAVPVLPEVYGSTPSAATFTEALERARLGCGTRVMREVGERTELAGRVRSVAGMGRQLDVDSGDVAAGAAPGSVPPLSTPAQILQGMGGG